MTDFRLVPSIEQLLRRPSATSLEARYGADATRDALRLGAAAARKALTEGADRLEDADAVTEHIVAVATAHLDAVFRSSLQPVINATGVIVHTNLGRAPLSAGALARVAEVAGSYATLEYDLARGARGARHVHAEALLCRLTGAEAASVV